MISVIKDIRGLGSNWDVKYYTIFGSQVSASIRNEVWVEVRHPVWSLSEVRFSVEDQALDLTRMSDC